MVSKSQLLEMLEIFEKKIGAEKSELYYKNPYTFAVAVLLSAQSTDKIVNVATKTLFELADNPKDMLKLGVEEIKKHIKIIGFFNMKAKHIIEMSEMIISDFGGNLPDNRENLMKLPGIGRKSANVILNELYGTPTIGVDTHVLRLVKRLGLMNDKFKTPEEVEFELERIIPQKYKPFVSNYLVLFGRYVCKAKNPDCTNCYMKKFCKVCKK